MLKQGSKFSLCLLLLLLLLLLVILSRGSAPDDTSHLKASEDLQVAERFYQREVSLNPQSADAWHGLSVVLRRMEDIDGAVLAMHGAVLIDPSATLVRELGLLLRLQSREQEGITALERSITLGAISSTTLLLIGRFRHASGDLESAIRTIRLSMRTMDVALRGGHAAALAMVLLDAGDLVGARDAFHAASSERLLVRVGERTWTNPFMGIRWPPVVLQGRRIGVGEGSRTLLTLCDQGNQSEREEAANLLHQELSLLQYPDRHRCSSLPQLVYVLSGAKDGVGLGCEFHGMVLALAEAYRKNRTLVLSPSPWWLAGTREQTDSWPCEDSARLDTSGFTCFFQPISTCRFGDSPDYEEFTPGRQEYSPASKFWIPSKFQSHGLLWWRSMLSRFLFRPQESLQHPPLPNNLGHIGIHIRKGDKVSEVPVQPIGSYVQATLQVLQTLEVSLPPLLVVSDGSAALRQFSQHMREVADVEILADDLPQAPNLPTGRSGKLAIDFPETRVADMTRKAVRDVWLLSHSKALVLTMTSNFGRLAYELAFALRGGCPPLTVTLDVLWHDPH